MKFLEKIKKFKSKLKKIFKNSWINQKYNDFLEIKDFVFSSNYHT